MLHRRYLPSQAGTGLIVHRHDARGPALDPETLGVALQRGVRLALLVVVPHILEARELGLAHDGPALRAWVLHDFAGRHVDDVRLAVLYILGKRVCVCQSMDGKDRSGRLERCVVRVGGYRRKNTTLVIHRDIVLLLTHLLLVLEQSRVCVDELLLGRSIGELEHGDSVDGRHLGS